MSDKQQRCGSQWQSVLEWTGRAGCHQHTGDIDSCGISLGHSETRCREGTKHRSLRHHNDRQIGREMKSYFS